MFMRPLLGKLRLRHFQVVELLAETGTVRAVAERLHLSQPAVSQMVKDLETAFRVQLFSRSKSGMAPREELLLLLGRTRVMLGELATAETELSTDSTKAAIVRVGAQLHMLTLLLPRVMSGLDQKEPPLRFSVREGSTSEMLKALAAGELDCAIGRLSEQHYRAAPSSEMAFWPILSGELCIVAGPQHPLTKRRKLSLRDLTDEKWALSEETGESRKLLEAAFVREGLRPPQPVLGCRPFAVNLTMAAQLPIITLAMRSAALLAQQRREVRILPVDLKLDAPPIALICRKSAAETPLISRVRAAILTAAAGLEKGRWVRA
jgi:DNA-binding transcriptional LysR family regulator